MRLIRVPPRKWDDKEITAAACVPLGRAGNSRPRLLHIDLNHAAATERMDLDAQGGLRVKAGRQGFPAPTLERDFDAIKARGHAGRGAAGAGQLDVAANVAGTGGGFQGVAVELLGYERDDRAPYRLIVFVHAACHRAGADAASLVGLQA